MTDKKYDQGSVMIFHSVYECCKCLFSKSNVSNTRSKPVASFHSLSRSLSGLHGSRRDVSGRRDSRNESDEGPEAAAHAAVAGVETPLSHSRPPPQQQQDQDRLEPAESQSLLFLCIDVVHDLYIHTHISKTQHFSLLCKSVSD